MKYYKGRREPSKGLITRILIVVLVCLLAFVITVFIGNRLKAKLDQLDSSHGVGGDASSEESVSAPSTPDVDEKNDQPAASRRAYTAYIPPSELAGATGESLSELAQSGYTAIAIPLTRDDGTLLYASDAARDYARADYPDSYPDPSLLATILAKAESAGLRTVALYAAPDLYSGSAADDFRVSLDRVIAREIAEMGFDEITLLGTIGAGGVNTDSAITVLGYVAEIRRAARASGASPDISITLDYKYFLDVSCAQQIELLADYIEVLTIDMRSHDNPAALCDSLSGSFSLYSLRALTDSEDVMAEIRSYTQDNVLLIPAE